MSVLNEDAVAGSKVWYTDSDLPSNLTKRRAPAAITCNNKLVIAGGYDTNNQPLDLVEILDLATKERKWTSTRMILTLGAPSAVSCGGYVYLLGGYNNNDEMGSSRAFRCHIDQLFNAQPTPCNGDNSMLTTSWEEIEEMPRTHVAAVSFGEHVIIVGGMGPSSKVTSDIFCYSNEGTSKGTWQLVNNIPTPRYNSTAAMLPKCQLMVIGGRTGERSSLTKCIEIVTLCPEEQDQPGHD